MPKISRDTMIQRLIELYNSDAEVRARMIPEIQQELQRLNLVLGLGEIDWDFMRLPKKLLEQNPTVYFERLMQHFYQQHNYAWIADLYQRNRDAIWQRNQELE